jgi:toxin ParE1/3/4
MNRKVVLRPQIPDDLHAITEYLDRSSTVVADRFFTSAFAAFDDIAAQPGMGSPKHFNRANLGGIRSWAIRGFPNHLIYYRVHAEAVIILAVLHGARDIGSILNDRNP